MGKNKVAVQASATGRQASDNELGVIISQIRKYLSIAFIRAQNLCLINRLKHLGEGHKTASGRRNFAMRFEMGRRREREDHYQAHICGLELSRVGQLFVDHHQSSPLSETNFLPSIHFKL